MGERDRGGSIGLWRSRSGTWERLALLSAGSTRFTDWAPPPGSIYRVQVVTETGVSPWSNEASVTGEPPPPPTDQPRIDGTVWIPGGDLEVTGRNFGAEPGTIIWEGGLPLAAEVWSDTRVRFRPPPLTPDPEGWTFVLRRSDGREHSTFVRRAAAETPFFLALDRLPDDRLGSRAVISARRAASSGADWRHRISSWSDTRIEFGPVVWRESVIGGFLRRSWLTVMRADGAYYSALRPEGSGGQ